MMIQQKFFLIKYSDLKMPDYNNYDPLAENIYTQQNIELVEHNCYRRNMRKPGSIFFCLTNKDKV